MTYAPGQLWHRSTVGSTPDVCCDELILIVRVGPYKPTYDHERWLSVLLTYVDAVTMCRRFTPVYDGYLEDNGWQLLEGG